jgi:hypothetical protein
MALSGFGIFWYRYLLLGPQSALKFGFSQLIGMIWRFIGYGFLVWVVCVTVFTVATLLACLLGSLVNGLIGQSGTLLAYIIQFTIVGWAYIWPLNFAARTALIFPAMAVGRPIALSEAWAASKDSAGSLVWALLLAGVSLLLLSLGVHSFVFGVLGIDGSVGGAAPTQGRLWAEFLLSPVSNLWIAAMLSVVSIAYRDLLGRVPVPEMAADADLAH